MVEYFILKTLTTLKNIWTFLRVIHSEMSCEKSKRNVVEFFVLKTTEAYFVLLFYFEKLNKIF